MTTEVGTDQAQSVNATLANSVRLRAIAREMGMTAPAIYRYFDSLDARTLEQLAR
jgi:AcrR family transcriptional regulator